LPSEQHLLRGVGHDCFDFTNSVPRILAAKAIEDMGAHSLCIKDMAGLLHPYDAYDLVKKLKATVDIPIQLHAHFVHFIKGILLAQLAFHIGQHTARHL
jgi:oxaloacetate decarboxylase alpha subunit